jgi:acyl-CoA reductase-like NAD-dependent aldehyde dehydrogenase
VSAAQHQVRSPWSGEIVGSVPLAAPEDVERALALAGAAVAPMRRLAAHERSELLRRAADAVERDEPELARIITAEQGKHTVEARAEAGRIAGIIRLCAEEAGRLDGRVIPLDVAAAGVGRLAYTRPEPTGVVVAITPFNYPAILVIHKIAPALAAGNPVILKPAGATPLTALFLVERLRDAGLPEGALQALVGPGASVGSALCADDRVRKISFTGSEAVGHAIARAAGAKRLTCELGSNAALVVLDDADLVRAARAIAFSAFTNAGQNCVSTQRVLVARSRRDELLDGLTARVDSLRPGDPSDPATDLAPLIDEREAERVTAWIAEAADAGADVVRGGGRDRALVEPGVILDPPTDARVWRDELFGPAVSVRAFEHDDDALAAANATRFGLAMSVCTRDVDRALHFAHGLRAGLVHVNPEVGATWRVDTMPWGGFGASGFGKEGVRDAVRDMTEEKLVVIHPGNG